MPARTPHHTPLLATLTLLAVLAGVHLSGMSGVSEVSAQLLSPENQDAVQQRVEETPEGAETAQTAPSAPVTTQAPINLEAAPVQATSDAISLTAIPPRLGDEGGLVAVPGQTIQETIRVRNTGDTPIQYSSIAQDFIIAQDGTTPVAVSEDVSTRWSLADWIVLAPQSGTIQPGETGQIAVVIEVPSDALPGGHYAMITHQPSNGNGDGTTSSAVNQRVGTLIYLTVDGPINEEAFIRNLTFPNFVEYGPVPFSLEVDNQSDIHITPTITVDIYNFMGKQVESIGLETKNIFPFSAREFTGEWDRVWGIGPYTAKITMSYGNQGRVTLATERFWLMPASLIAAGVVSVLAAFAIIIAIRRHLDHRNDSNRKRVEVLEQELETLRQNQTATGMNQSSTQTDDTPPYQKYQ